MRRSPVAIAMAVLSIAATADPSLAQSDAPPSAHPGDGAPDPAGRIAFGRIVRMDDFYGQIVALYAIDPDGSDLVQLNEGESAYPAWSPDGTRLAFTMALPDGSFQIAVMAADGSDVRVLTSGPGVSEVPSWSPDGTWIAYDHARRCRATTLAHRRCTGWMPTARTRTLLGDPDTFDMEPRISPDGTEVVFTRLRIDGGSQQQVIIVRDLASGKERAIEAAGTAPEHPNWSPDGEWIIYNIAAWMTDAVPRDQLERIAADGSGEPVVLLEGTPTQAAFKPWYSPDGTRILLGCLGPGGDDAACLMNADGTNLEILIDEPGVHENHFSWGIATP